MAWTEERVEELKKLWAEGHSASQIAARMGGVTRNAVIGKVHRLGLSGRAAPAKPKAVHPEPKEAAPVMEAPQRAPLRSVLRDLPPVVGIPGPQEKARRGERGEPCVMESRKTHH